MGLHSFELSLEFLPDCFILNGLQLPNRPIRHLLRDFFQTAFQPGDLDFLLVPELVQLLLPPDFEFAGDWLPGWFSPLQDRQFSGEVHPRNARPRFSPVSRNAVASLIKTPAPRGVPQSSIRWMRRPARAKAGTLAPAWLH